MKEINNDIIGNKTKDELIRNMSFKFKDNTRLIEVSISLLLNPSIPNMVHSISYAVKIYDNYNDLYASDIIVSTDDKETLLREIKEANIDESIINKVIDYIETEYGIKVK